MIINGTTVPNPEWQDSKRSTSINQNVHHARNGSTIRIYKMTSNYERVKFNIGYVQYDDAWSVFNAISSDIHQQISITDWNDNTWSNCRIITNPFEVSHVIKKCTDDYGTEGYQLTLEFEGVPS